MTIHETHLAGGEAQEAPDFLFLATVDVVSERKDEEVMQELKKANPEAFEFPFAEAFRFLEARYPGITVEIFEQAEQRLEKWHEENPSLWQNLAQAG